MSCQLPGGDVGANLLGLRRTGDHGRDPVDRGEPADRELEQRVAAAGGERLQLLGPREPLVAEPAVVQPAEPRSLGLGLAAPVLAGQEAALEREVGDVAHPELARERQHGRLVVAVDQAEEVLHRDDRAVAGLREGGRLLEVAGLDVREPEPAHLALDHELVHRAEGLVERGDAVGTVVVVEVDVVAAEALERRVDRPPHVLARAAGSVPVRSLHVHAELRRDDEVVRAAGEGLPDDALAGARSVDVGGVEERDAGIDRSGENLERRVTVDPAAEVVAAEADPRDGEGRATERVLVHRSIVRQAPSGGVRETRGTQARLTSTLS